MAPGLAAHAKTPFLEVLTRHYTARPQLFARQQASLARQTDEDWQQTVLRDEEGAGLAAANAMLADYAPQVAGDYAWVLDDDDECIHDSLVFELREIAARTWPDVIMLRMAHGLLGILPDDTWGQTPQYGRVASSCFVVRRELWHRFGERWRVARGGDFNFIFGVVVNGADVTWHDVVASRTQVADAQGRPESRLAIGGGHA